jgi:hypothetical protein
MTATPTTTPTTGPVTADHPATASLLIALEAQHQRILAVMADLDDTTLRRPLFPAGWSFGGMVRHLGLGAEFWCNHVIAGRPAQIIGPGEDFVMSDGPATDTVAEAAARLARARHEVAPLAPGTAVGWFPEGLWGDWRLDTVEEVLLHLLAEATCHAGHLDIGRELLDGRT